MEYLISSLIGYLLGSLPTAYLILKKYKDINITEAGTGNIGAMNSYEVTNSKMIGILVFLIDAFKGLLSVYLILIIFPLNFTLPALSLLFAVFAHCFNPWVGFKGGRGLATAAGGSVLLFPFLLVIWSFIWVIIFFMKKDISFSNIWSTLMTLIILYTSSNIAFKYTFPKPILESEMILFATSLLFLIFIKHIEPLMELIKQKKIFVKEKKNDTQI